MAFKWDEDHSFQVLLAGIPSGIVAVNPSKASHFTEEEWDCLDEAKQQSFLDLIGHSKAVKSVGLEITRDWGEK